MVANVIAIKWGNVYGPGYVNRLRNSVARNLGRPHRFVCFTDNDDGIDDEIETYPIPDIHVPDVPTHCTTWKKLALFQTGIGDLKGSCLFFDLDIVITGSLDEFFEHEKGRFCGIREWVQPHRKVIARRPTEINASVFRFEADSMQHVLDEFNSDPEFVLRNFRHEQRFISHLLGSHVSYWPAHWVVSFKRHCLPAFPLNLLRTPELPSHARIVAFHGNPKPQEAMKGFVDGPIHRKCRATPWINEYWGSD